jgi:hypothetical protein
MMIEQDGVDRGERIANAGRCEECRNNSHSNAEEQTRLLSSTCSSAAAFLCSHVICSSQRRPKRGSVVQLHPVWLVFPRVRGAPS